MMGIELFFETMEKLTPYLLRGELAVCETMAADALRDLPRTPFHIGLDLSITNDAREAAKHFDAFYRLESQQISVKAIYTEMNGFDINPDRWYCDLFAYEADGGSDDFDWICDWQSQTFEDYTITGLEQLQAVYANKAISYDPANGDARYLSSLLVVAKFQRFMQLVAEKAGLPVPLYVTAHDFDYIARLPGRLETR